MSGDHSPCEDIGLSANTALMVPRLLRDPLWGPAFRKIVIACFNRLTLGGTFNAEGQRIDDGELPRLTVQEREVHPVTVAEGYVRHRRDGAYRHDEILKEVGFTTREHKAFIDTAEWWKAVRVALRLPEFLGLHVKVIAVNANFLNPYAVDRNGEKFFDRQGLPIPAVRDYARRPASYLAGIGKGTRAVGAVHPAFAHGTFLHAKRAQGLKQGVGFITKQVLFQQDTAARMAYRGDLSDETARVIYRRGHGLLRIPTFPEDLRIAPNNLLWRE